MADSVLTLERFDEAMVLIHSRFEKIDRQFDSINTRFTTIDTTLNKIDTRFNKIDARFSKIDDRFSKIDARFEMADTRFDTIDSHLDSHKKLISSLIVGQENILEEIRDVRQRTIHLEQSMEDVQYSLSTLTKAEEKDAEASINHELRLRNLEKINKIKANPPAHLIDIQV